MTFAERLSNTFDADWMQRLGDDDRRSVILWAFEHGAQDGVAVELVREHVTLDGTVYDYRVCTPNTMGVATYRTFRTRKPFPVPMGGPL